MKKVIPFIVLICAALCLRLYNIGHSNGAHPDERFIVGMVLQLSEKGFNPGSFAYGSLPFYIVWGIAKFISFIGLFPFHYDNLFIVGRVVTSLVVCLISLVASLVSYKIYRNYFGALLTTFLFLFTPFSLQESKFFTVDPYVALFSILSILYLMKYVEKKRNANFLLGAVFQGAAMACKTSGLLLFLPAFLTLVITQFSLGNYLSFRARTKIEIAKDLSIIAGKFGLYVIVVISTIFICAPFFFLDSDTFITNQVEQLSMVAGRSRPPYVIQYMHTEPFFYHLKQMFKLMVSPVGMIIFGLGTWFSLFSKNINKTLFLILFVWLGVFFLSTAGQMVKFPRYLFPIYSGIAILGGGLFALNDGKLYKTFFGALSLLCVIACQLLYTLAQFNIYTSPHTWTVASDWVYKNIPVGSRLLSPHWDDRIPLSDPKREAISIYQIEGKENEFPLYELPDNSTKLQILTDRLARTDYLIFPTQRMFTSIPRVPDEYPLVNSMYSALFHGKLGFTFEKTFSNRPKIFGLEINDDILDESLSVYDHPKAWIFKNTSRLTSEEIYDRVMNGLKQPHLSNIELLNQTNE